MMNAWYVHGWPVPFTPLAISSLPVHLIRICKNNTHRGQWKRKSTVEAISQRQLLATTLAAERVWRRRS